MKLYILYDGRAEYDIDSASVVETIGEFDNDAKPIKLVRRDWTGYDSVLVKYDISGEFAENPEIVEWRPTPRSP